MPASNVGDSNGTARASGEEGGDDVKSSRPLRPGLHTCYNGYYRGDAASTAGLTLKYTSAMAAVNTKQFEAGSLPSIGSTAKVFRAGDLIQKTGSTYVYTVTADVARGAGSTVVVPVNRSILDAPNANAAVAKIGPAVEWTVVCTQRPDWRLIAKDIIEWTGEFVFQEVS